MGILTKLGASIFKFCESIKFLSLAGLLTLFLATMREHILSLGNLVKNECRKFKLSYITKLIFKPINNNYTRHGKGSKERLIFKFYKSVKFLSLVFMLTLFLHTLIH